ncbi:MAG: DUF6541 family protein [Anaerolineae bacterium]
MIAAGGADVAGVWLAACIASALTVPGLAALGLTGHDSRGFDRLALAVGVSVALWPLAFLWTSLVGVRWSAPLVWAAMAVLVATVAAVWWRSRRGATSGGDGTPDRETVITPGREAVITAAAPGAVGRPRSASASLGRGSALALAFVLAVAVALRVWQARDLVVTPWVDGLHHTMIVQLILDGGVVPEGFRPYLPVDGFYYHFGFHVVAAVVSWLSGAPAASATLWTGQALSAVSCLTVYALALRLTRNRSSAVLAAAVPAALYFFPSYYVSWGRFTQLAGLVALPVAWILAADAATRVRPARGQLLAAACGAGLMLVHYRVFVYFLIGVLIMVAYGAAVWRRAGDRGARLVAISVAGGALAAPWLAVNLVPGVRALSAAGAGWLGGPQGVTDVPAWLFRTASNAVWVHMGLRGLVVGVVARPRSTAMIVSFLALASLAAYPQVLGVAGVSTSWALPPFALAISAYVPVALGMALLADAALDLGVMRGRDWSPAVIATAVALTAVGAAQLRDVVNSDTIIATTADLRAAEWIVENTPPDAVFLVSTYHWHLGTYRGLDGGYWLPLLAGRHASIPPSFYVYGDPEYARRITETAQTVQAGDQMSDDELLGAMRSADADFVYVGPASADTDGKLTADRLREHPSLRELYAADDVYVFGLAGAQLQ